jgi:MFS family permease
MTYQEQKRRRPAVVTPRFVLLTVASLAYFSGGSALYPVMPRFVRGPLGGSDADVGLAVGAFSFTAVLLRPLVGSLGDRFGRKPLWLFGAGAFAASVVFYGQARSVETLLLLRLINGVGEAFFFTGTTTSVADMAPEERRGEAVSLYSVSIYLSLALGPLMGETLLEAFGFQFVWYLSAALSAIAVVLLAPMPETKPADLVAQRMRLIHRKGIAPGVVIAASVWAFAGFTSFVVLYARELGLRGAREMFALLAVIVLVIRVVGAKLPDWLGARRTAALSLVGSMLGLVTLWAFGSPAGLAAGTVLLAVGAALAFPALMSLTIGRVGPAERASVVGTFTAFIDLGWGVAPVAIGLIADASSYRVSFLASAIAPAVGLATLAAIPSHGSRGDR